MIAAKFMKFNVKFDFNLNLDSAANLVFLI